MTAHTLTSAQCKRARALLKWNPQDLAIHTRIPVRQIEKFERNQVKLMRPENEEIVEAFETHGVIFRPTGDVHLKPGQARSDHVNASAQDQVIYHIEEQFVSAAASDSPASSAPPKKNQPPIISE